MFCRKCGNEIVMEEKFCPFCGTEVETVEEPVTMNENVYENRAEQNNVEMISKNANNVLGIIASTGGMAAGVLSIIFGFVLRSASTGLYELSNEYGGEAYTGIQNAAAQTANNVTDLAEVVRDGISYLLIAVGLIVIFGFMFKLYKCLARKCTF